MPQRFMLVDDDATHNMLCGLAIKRAFNRSFKNANVISFEFPGKALEFIASEYDDSTKDVHTMLFLDINMPDINGWDFLKVFAKMDKHIQDQFTIYILSSSIDPADEIKANSNAFVTSFLSKPLLTPDVEKLMETN